MQSQEHFFSPWSYIMIWDPPCNIPPPHKFSIHLGLINHLLFWCPIFLSFLTLTFPLSPNVTGDGKMQQDPTHCEDPTNAPTLEKKGTHRSRTCRSAVRCSCRTRGGVRGEQLQKVHRARDAPEPPHLQTAPRTSRRRVRLFQPRPTNDPMRRVALRRGTPSRDSLLLLLRVHQLGPVRRLSGTLPRRHLGWISFSPLASWPIWY